MTWKIDFYDGIEDVIVGLPSPLRAKFYKTLEMIRVKGANLGYPQTKKIEDGLFEVRAEADGNAARGLFCYMTGKHIYILHVFMKKKQKTPEKDKALARARMSEVMKHE